MNAKSYFKRTLSSSNLSAAGDIHEYVKFQLEYFQSNNMKYLKCDMINSSILIQSSFSKEILMFICDEKRIKDLLMNGVLNWCELARPLCPINTENDGNSLLHSISLYTLGVHDRYNFLRQLLNHRLKIEPLDGEMRNRWLVHSPQSSATQSWDYLLELTSDKKHFYQGKLKIFPISVSFHIFVMANIFGRPIVVLSEQPINDNQQYGGIYLPLLRNHNDCIRSPIVLVYDNNSFSPALSCESVDSGFFLSPLRYAESASHCVPLVHKNLVPFKIHFLFPSELRDQDNILSMFLDISCLDVKKIKVAFLTFKAPLALSTELMNSFLKEAVKFVNDDLPPKNSNFNNSYRRMGGFENSLYTEGQSSQFCLPPVSEIQSRLYNSEITETSNKVRGVTFQDEDVKQCLARLCTAVGLSKYKGYCYECFNEIFKSKKNVNKNENDKYDFDRTKVFCIFAGCESNVSTKHSTLCDLHMGGLRKCCLNGCENTADDNDVGLCLTCYQNNKHILKFNESTFVTSSGSNKTDKHFDEFLSMIHNLPPLPSTGINPLSEDQAPRHTIYGSGYPQNTCEMNNTQSFKLPPSFQTSNQQSFENSQSSLIWQKPFVDSNYKTCKKCKVKTADLNDLCLNCFQSFTCKECGENTNDELIQGLLCNKCYMMQQKHVVETSFKNNLHNVAYHRQDYNLHEFKNLSKDMSPCSTPGCILFTSPPFSKCHVCEKKEGVAVENFFEIKKCLKSQCDFYGSPEYNGLCSGCFMELTIKESTQKQTYQRKEENAPIKRNYSLSSYPDMVLREELNNPILASSYTFTGENPCLTKGCASFGSRQKNGLCDRCYHSNWQN